MDCDVHFAKTNLSKLLKQVESGDEVFITRRGERVVQLTRVGKPKLQFGTLAQLGAIDDALLGPMTDEEGDEFIAGNWG